MKGKDKCRILTELRRQIAEKNELSYVTSECKHRGDCLGTCPKCEAEVRDLERQIRERSLAGKRFVAVGLAVGMAALGVGCDASDPEVLSGDMIVPEVTDEAVDDGLMPETGSLTEGEILMGAPALPDGDTSQWELMGEPMPAPEDTEANVGTEDPWDMGEVPDTTWTEDSTWLPAGMIEPPIMGDIIVPMPDTEEPLMGEPVPEETWPAEKPDTTEPMEDWPVITPDPVDPEETVGEDAIPYETETVAPVAPPYDGREPSGG